MNGGKLDDGTPWVAIGAGEPEVKEFIVHCECKACGKQHYFDFWAMFMGEVITCEHCGHSTVSKRQKLVDGEWVDA